MMLVTEAEALGKWCPMARSNNENDAPNRTHQNEIQAGCNCIASDCMVWRWSYAPEEAKGNKNGPLGYCGLAGKPA